jgi:hypothetical protein
LFREGVDPVQLYITIAGLSWFYLSNQHTLSAIFGRDLLDPVARAARLDHMIEVVLSWLARPTDVMTDATTGAMNDTTSPAASDGGAQRLNPAEVPA